MISKELLSDVLNDIITLIEVKDASTLQSGMKHSEIVYVGKKEKRQKINSW